jgi:hypothetical protein
MRFFFIDANIPSSYVLNSAFQTSISAQCAVWPTQLFLPILIFIFISHPPTGFQKLQRELSRDSLQVTACLSSPVNSISKGLIGNISAGRNYKLIGSIVRAANTIASLGGRRS